MNEQEKLKAEFEKKKIELEKIEITHENNDIQIVLDLNSTIKKISYNGQEINFDLINELNIAINKSKTKLDKDWKNFLLSYGISF